jgi:hypothetical protein
MAPDLITYLYPTPRSHLHRKPQHTQRDHRDRVFLGPRTFLELGDIVRAHNLEPPQILIY